MDVIADTVILIAEAFKAESLISQILFLGALIGLPLWFLRLARASLRQERSKALDDLKEVTRNFGDLEIRHDEVMAELDAAKICDPETFLKDVTPQRRDENNEKVQERCEDYLEATAEAQGAAHVMMTEHHLARGRRELDEALRHARGAVAATPRDATARGLLSTVTGRIAEARKEPETEEEIAAEAEEARLATLLASDDVDAMTLYRVGQSEFDRGWYRIAAAIWERALTIAAAKDGSSSPFALQLRQKIARATLWAGELSKAERLARPLPAAMEAAHSSNALETLSAKRFCAEVELRLGRAAEAETQFRAVSSLQKILLGEEDEAVLSTSFYIAFALLDQGKAAEAEAAYRDLLPVRQRVSGAEHPHTLTTRSGIASALLSQGKAAEAEAAWRDLLPVWERVSGAEHPDTLVIHHEIARALLDQGKATEAEAAFRDLLPVRQRVSGAEHPHTLAIHSQITRALLDQGKVVEAEATLRDLLPVQDRVSGAEHPDTLIARYRLAQAMMGQARAAEAAADLEALAPLAARVLAATDPSLGYIAFLRAQCADKLGDAAVADEFLCEAEANWGDRLTPEHFMRREMAAYLADRNRPSES